MKRGGLTAWALLPLAVVVVVAYLGSVLWTLRISLSSSRALPRDDFIGMEQYVRLFESERWQQAVHNIAPTACSTSAPWWSWAFCSRSSSTRRCAARACCARPSLPLCDELRRHRPRLAVGAQPRERAAGRGSGAGLAGLPVRGIVDQDLVMYCIVFAGVWQGSGLVMALMLAGLRGVDEEIWKAAKLDGIPTWRVYLSIVLPMMAPTLATVFVLLSMGVIKLYDTVVAMTQRGAGTASDASQVHHGLPVCALQPRACVGGR